MIKSRRFNSLPIRERVLDPLLVAFAAIDDGGDNIDNFASLAQAVADEDLEELLNKLPDNDNALRETTAFAWGYLMGLADSRGESMSQTLSEWLVLQRQLEEAIEEAKQ